MRSDEYWEERALQREEYSRKTANRTIKNKTLKYYSKAQKDIDKRIKQIFERYAKNGELTPAEAKKLLNSRETEEELNALREELSNIKDPAIRKKALARLNAGAYRARISRLEALKANIETQSALLADREKRAIKSLLEEVSEETYYHHIYDTQIGTGFAFDFAAMPDKVISEIINDKWKGANFSQRVWLNTSAVANSAYGIVVRGIMTGASPQTMAQRLSESMQSGMYASMRLIRTEVNRVHNAAEREAYKEEEIEEYRFLATLDGRTCEECGRLDGKIYPVSEAKEGVNFPPLHPNDRCTTVQAMDKEALENLKRRARDSETGKTVAVPGDMTWGEWKRNVEEPKNVDNISKSGIIYIRSRNVNIGAIEFPIEQRHTGKGNPNAIITFGTNLNNRQKELLDKLPQFGSRTIVDKNKVKLSDLAALTAHTGDEFALFTKNGKRLVVRGNANMVQIDVDDASRLAEEGYKWSGHTHPGDNDFVLFASDGDKLILRQFKQEYSVILNSKGQYNIFGKE